MKRFQFPLDGLSRVRKQRLQDQEVELAKARRAHRHVRRSREEAERRLRERNQGAPRGEIVEVADLLAWDRNRQQVQREVVLDEEKLARWALQVEEERARLLEAHREAEAVEKLRERRYVEFVREVLRVERKEMDEVAARTHRTREAA